MDAPVLLTPHESESCISTLGWASWASDLDRIFLTVYNTASAWGTANKAVFFPFSNSIPRTIRKVTWLNGGTVNGNVDFGVYDRWGNLIQSLGSTAQSGATVAQVADITDFTIDPGFYFMAQASNSATATFTGSGVHGVPQMQIYGVQTMAAAFPLPSTVTFANPTGNVVIPWLAFNFPVTV